MKIDEYGRNPDKLDMRSKIAQLREEHACLMKLTPKQMESLCKKTLYFMAKDGVQKVRINGQWEWT